MSQKSMQLVSLILTHDVPRMSPGNPLILESKGQGHESQKHCWRWSLHSCECWLLLVTHFKNLLYCLNDFTEADDFAETWRP